MNHFIQGVIKIWKALPDGMVAADILTTFKNIEMPWHRRLWSHVLGNMINSWHTHNGPKVLMRYESMTMTYSTVCR